MKITKVKYYDIGVSDNSNFLSKCSIVFEDCVILHDIKILNGLKGRYIVMPERCGNRNTDSNRNSIGEDVFHPVRQPYFNYMKEVVLKGFELYESTGVKIYSPN